MPRRDLALLLLPAVAFLAGHALWRCDFALADDWELLCLLEPGRPDAVAWSAVAEDLHGPWLASEVRQYYRPLGTLALGAWLATVGFEPATLSWAPGLLHAAATALLALLLRRTLPGARTGAIALAAAFFAIHPATPEVTNWFTALLEPLQTVCGLAACHALLTARRRGSVAWLTVAGAATLGAMLAKESGLVAPVAVFALDFAVRGSRRPRLDQTLVAAVPLTIYLALRVAFTALSPTANAAPIDGAGFAAVGAARALADKLALVAAPLFEPAGDARPWLGLAAVALLVLATRRRAFAGGAVAVVAASLGTTLVAAATPTYVGARVLYAATVGFAFVLVAALGCPAGGRRTRRAIAVAVAVWLTVQTAAAAVRTARFLDDLGHAAKVGHACVTALRDRAAALPAGEPLALLGAPWEPRSVLTLLPAMTFPVVAGDPAKPTAVLGPHFGPPPGFVVPLSVRALAELPTTFVDDDPTAPGGVRFTPAAALRAPAGPAGLAALDADRYAFGDGPRSPFGCEAFEVTTATPAAEVAVAPLLAVPLPDDLDVAVRARPRSGATGVTVPVADAVAFLLARQLGGLVGVSVRATDDRGSPVTITAVRAVPRVPELPATIADLAAVTPATFATRLRTPPTTTPDGELWATLLCGGETQVFRAAADAPLALPPTAAAELRRILRVVPHQLAVLVFHERDPGAGPFAGLRARSAARRLSLRR